MSEKPRIVGWKILVVVAAVIVIVVALSSIKNSDRPATTPAPPTATTAVTASENVLETAAALSRLALVYLNTDESNREYWRRAVELLSEQDSVTLTESTDMNITIDHQGTPVTLYRSALEAVATESCLTKFQRKPADEAVTRIMDTWELQRPWEAAQLQQAALETKCPRA
ncbi:hypothetical protein [Mycobacteroides franklinii]|uniref:hypothetical protein n=1 Tax=Mycobacteroides franklinii TaxID=948102 RepID=UPI0013E8E6A7|nr:hypothetical protein [Mycobacteroides franklinii]